MFERVLLCHDGSDAVGSIAQLQTESLSTSLGHGRGSLRALGSHLALLFRERGVDVECEGVAIAPEGSDHEMHLVLHSLPTELPACISLRNRLMSFILVAFPLTF